MHTLKMAAATAAVGLSAALSGCGSSSAPAGATSGNGAGTLKYDATVTRTELGIPHIQANDFGSLGYGYGYSFAEDNLCVLQEDLVTIRGERARYFGANGSYTIVPNGSTADNVSSDFFWKFMADDAAWQRLRDSAAPDLQAVTQGFVDGYNRYIGELQAGDHPGRHLACRDGGWLFPISAADMYRRYYRLALIASSSVFVRDIANTQPPVGGAKAGAATLSVAEREAALKANPGPFEYFARERKFGSNMYALGPEATQSGQSMLFGNPHFPWSGTERLYISHLTVPGRIDIMGSSLYGVPVVLIGFTDQFAWSHTVSTAYRFTLYELNLAPGDPTSYLYDTEIRAMEAVPLSVDVLQDDGSLSTETRTLYRSHYGPMIALTTAAPGVGTVEILPWSTAKAYTLRDANAENDRLINQFASWNQAKSFEEFVSLHASVLGTPWVNTVATGPGKPAYYGDVTVVPHVTDAQKQTCSAQPLQQVIDQAAPGLPLLDGSRSACEWGSDDDAPAPGIFGPANLPKLTRDDWVHNCNDSYWLTNPAEPITGYDRIIGDEETARTLRTRLCILQVQRRLDGSDGRPGTQFADLAQLQDIVLSSQIYSAELAVDDVVDNICALGSVLTTGGPVDVSQACAVLAAWGRSTNLDAVGGHVWREFWKKADDANAFWLTPFSANDPVNTPRDINFASPEVQAALGDTVTQLEDLGVAFDAPLGTLQRSGIHDEVIPIFGGIGDTTGAFTVASTGALTADGYKVTYGNSYIQTVTWDANGVNADGFITYSQSTDPANPHFADYTKEYSAKRWHHFPFRSDEIAAQKIGEIRLTE